MCFSAPFSEIAALNPCLDRTQGYLHNPGSLNNMSGCHQRSHQWEDGLVRPPFSPPLRPKRGTPDGIELESQQNLVRHGQRRRQVWTPALHAMVRYCRDREPASVKVLHCGIAVALRTSQ